MWEAGKDFLEVINWSRGTGDRLSAQFSLGRKCPAMAWRQDKGHSGLGAVEEWGTQTREEFTERGELIQAPGEGV